MANIPFIIIDNDPKILNNLVHVIEKAFPNHPIFTEEDGIKGYYLATSKPTPSIVICELTTPNMTGMEMVSQLKKTNPDDYYFIIITNNFDTEIGFKALQRGVDDILEKPIAVEILVARLKLAVKVILLEKQNEESKSQIKQIEADKSNLTDKNKLLLEENQLLVQQTIGLINKGLNIKFPDKMARIPILQKIAAYIANRFEEYNAESLKELDRAVMLIYSGYLGVSDETLKKPFYKNGILSPYMEAIPLFSKSLIEEVHGFENIAKTLYHIFENIDGTGFPEKKKNWEIPKSSRILRAIFDYEHCIFNEKKTQDKAITEMFELSPKVYENDILAYLDQSLAVYDPAPGKKEIKIELNDLWEGMTIARRIITKSGLMLINKYASLNDELISKIKARSKEDGIVGDIFIFDQKK